MIFEELIKKDPVMIDALEDFLPLAMAYLGINKLPKIKLLPYLPNLKQPSFGRFINNKVRIEVAIKNRHPLDVLRTLAHELAHFKQYILGEIGPDSGKTGSLQENQAHEAAGIIMRDFNKKFPQYIESKSLLSEARGIFARDAGDRFKDNTTGEVFEFEGIVRYPADANAYSSPHERDEALANEIVKIRPREVNRKNDATLAFAMATFKSQNSVRHYLKYFNDVSGNMYGKWLPSAIPGLTAQTKATEKAKANLKAQELLDKRTDEPVAPEPVAKPGKTGKKEKIDVKEVVGHKFSSGSELTHALLSIPDTSLPTSIKETLESFDSLPIVFNTSKSSAAVTDDLGEIVQALAFVRGLVTNADAVKAKNTVFGEKVEWQDLGITFPGGKTAGLVDFILTHDDKKLGVSTKSGSGAKASSKNLWDSYVSLDDDEKKKFKKKYKSAIETLIIIVKGRESEGEGAGVSQSAVEAPLLLGIKHGVLTEKQAEEVRRLYDSADTNTDPKMSTWARSQAEKMGVKSTSKWYWGYRLLASVAKDVAARVNKDAKISDGFLELLRKASLLQAHSLTSSKPGQVSFNSFTITYPAVFTGRLELTHDKTYFTTERPKGRYVFKFV